MPQENAIFLYVTGAGTANQVPDLIRAFLARGITVYSVLTPNVALVLPPATIMDVPGNHWIHEYRQDPLDRYPFGTMLVAPCTFNTFNKIALGLADNLATSMIADGLGAGCPVVIAPSMNHGLWAHPQTRWSLDRLRNWGCAIVDPVVDGPRVTMAPVGAVITVTLRAHRAV